MDGCLERRRRMLGGLAMGREVEENEVQSLVVVS